MRASNRAIFLVLLILLSVVGLAFAAVPQTIKYQGYLKDNTGVPVNTATSIRFSLYSSNPARNNPVWTETKDVTPSNGIYSTQLGSSSPITAPFDVPYWLGVKVEGDAEMALQALASVPYAKRAAVADSVTNNSVGTGTITDSSVTTAKIAAGAVTDTKISGTISAAKLDLSGVQKKYAKVAVVAQSGSDYSDPVTAMAGVAAWCGLPSASNPCLLKIMPGIYDLGSGTLAMQPYVDIEGSGELATTITSAISGEFNATVRGGGNAELRFLTVKNTAPYTFSVWGVGINNSSGSPKLTNITVTTSVASNSCGIYNINSSPIINNVTVTATGVDNSYGLVNNPATPTLTNVTISANSATGSKYGILNNSSAPRMVNVIATATGGTNNFGMVNSITSPGTFTLIIDRSTFEGSTNSILNNQTGYTLKIGASKLIGPVGPVGTFNYFASYSDTTSLDSATIGTQTFQTGADGNKGLVIRANSGSQSANLQEWQSSIGTAVASISPSGVFTGNGSGLTNIGTVTSISAGTGLTGGTITGSGTLAIDSAVVPKLSNGNVFTGTQIIQTGAAGLNGLMVQGVAGQVANLQEWVNNAGTTVASVSPAGVITGNGSGLTDVNAQTINGQTLSQLDSRYASNLTQAPPIQNPRVNTISALEVSGGVDTSITIGADGLPIISYYSFWDAGDRCLKVAKCTNASCSSSTITKLDRSSTGSVGRYSSIAIGTDSLPIISYYDAVNGDLKVAKCSNASCTSATYATLDGTGVDVGQYTSIAIGTDGLPIISYYDVTNGNLKTAKCANSACSTATVSTLDGAGANVGKYTSIAIATDGLPILSYFDSDLGNLKVVKCTTADCSGTPTITAVGSAGYNGYTTSIAIGADGMPVISFFNNGLKAAKCTNPTCSASTVYTLVPGPDVGAYSALSIGVDGLPVISYSDYISSGRLNVAKCSDINCASASTITVIDSTDNPGWYSSIAVGMDGLPVISYYDTLNAQLRIAKCANQFCVNNWSRR